MLLLFRYVLFLPLLFISLALCAEPAQTIKHSADGWSGQLLKYQKDFMRIALEQAQEKYGPYDIEFIDRGLSSNRTLSELVNGSIDSSFGSGISVESNQYLAHLEQLQYPYTKALHGLRRCITTNENVQKLSRIKDIDELKAVRLGQGVNWPELNIYRQHSIKVHSSLNIEKLVKMLSLQRFECLPLSVLEIDAVLDKALKKYKNLVIAPKLYIFYPNPISINLSKKNKHSSEVIRYGVQKMFETGEIDRVFNKNFKIRAKDILPKNSTLIILDNHLIPRENNLSTIEYFKNTHIRKEIFISYGTK